MQSRIHFWLLLGCLGLIVSGFAEETEDDIFKGLGKYHQLKKGGSFIHVSTPPGYDPSIPHPLLISLHYKSGNGAAFLPSFQSEADKQGWIVACPDSANHFDWSWKESQNKTVIRRTVKHLRSKFNIPEDQVYLFGHDSGAEYILYLMLRHDSVLKLFSACSVSSAEILTPIENRLWKKPRFMHRNAKLPILYMYSKDDTLITPVLAHGTRDSLRQAGYPIHYLESNNYGHNYPDHLTRRIFEWSLGKKGDQNEILWQENDKLKQPLEAEPLTESISIINITRRQANRAGNTKALNKIEIDPGNTVTIYQVRFRLEERNSELDLPFPEDQEQIWIELRTYDKSFNLVHRDETALIGLEAGLRMSRNYMSEAYGTMHKESNARIEKKNRLRTGDTATMDLAVPWKPSHDYAVILIHRNGRPAALMTEPSPLNHHQFTDLENYYRASEWEEYLIQRERDDTAPPTGPIYLEIK